MLRVSYVVSENTFVLQSGTLWTLESKERLVKVAEYSVCNAV